MIYIYYIYIYGLFNLLTMFDMSRYDIIKASSAEMAYSINMQAVSTAIAVNTGLISLSQLEKVHSLLI